MWRASVQDQNPQLAKKNGDCWLDFPLVTTEGEVLGKVTLGCDQTLGPQEFEAFSVLSAWFANVLAAMRDRIAQAKHRWVLEATELSMARMAHNMNTQFAPLGLILARYRRKEKECSGCLALNEQFEYVYGHLSKIALSAKEKLGVVRIDPREFDLLPMLKKVLTTNLKSTQWMLICSEPTVNVEADENKLEHVISELLYNARKNISQSTTLMMRVKVRLAGNEVRLCFRDNGPGIPDDNKERIFDNFYHTYSGRDDDYSQGLGLNWARRVLEEHGGTLIEQGTFGDGACFSARLPIHAKRSAPADGKDGYVPLSSS